VFAIVDSVCLIAILYTINFDNFVPSDVLPDLDAISREYSGEHTMIQMLPALARQA